MKISFPPAFAVFLVLCLPLVTSCRKPASTQNGIVSEEKTQASHNPAWLDRIITDFKQEKPTNPPIKIYRYLYRNQEVYYVSSRCCDIPSQVYDNTGKQLCQPDGGITGRGDGKCGDFFQTRTNEKLIWEDLRN